MGRIYNALDRFLPFDRYLDPMFGAQPTASPIPGRPPMRGMAPQGSSGAMGSLAMPQAGAPRVAMGEKRVPKVSKLRVLDGVLGGLTFTDAIDAERARPAKMAAAQEEDAIARQVFKDDQRGYLAWRANREETGKAIASSLEDYTLAPGAVRGRGTQQIMRAPTAPQILSAGQQMRGEGGQLIASAPFKPEVVTRSPGEAIDVIDPNSTNDIFAALIQQESGGRGDAVGPQTPYGRALGSTQMLPETAKGMADKLGLPWQPELMTQTTPQAMQYQQTLGRAYFDEGLQRYGGDPEKALKYYHGGPDERLWGPKTEAYAAAVLERMGPRSQTVSQATPKPGFRPATAEEKAAYGIPADQAAQISPDGKIDPVGERLKAVPIPVVQALTGNNAGLATIDRALRAIEAYPGAVGAANYLPDPIRQRQDPRGIDARATIADIGSMVIHDRSGAAVTAAEFPRLAPFIPSATDSPETVRRKLLQLREKLSEDTAWLAAPYGEENGYRPLTINPPARSGAQGATPAAPTRTGAATPPPPRRDAPAAKPAAATPPRKAAPAAASGAPVKVRTVQEAEQLPPNTRFVLPDGRSGTKR